LTHIRCPCWLPPLWGGGRPLAGGFDLERRADEPEGRSSKPGPTTESDGLEHIAGAAIAGVDIFSTVAPCGATGGDEAPRRTGWGDSLAELAALAGPRERVAAPSHSSESSPVQCFPPISPPRAESRCDKPLVPGWLTVGLRSIGCSGGRRELVDAGGSWFGC